MAWHFLLLLRTELPCIIIFRGLTTELLVYLSINTLWDEESACTGTGCAGCRRVERRKHLELQHSARTYGAIERNTKYDI